MKNDTHDNDDFDPWSSIGLQTAMILNRLRMKAQLLDLQTDRSEKCVENDQPDADRAQGKKEEDQRQFIERRVR